MKAIITGLLVAFQVLAFAQTPKQVIQKVSTTFNKVADYSADINMQFNIPAVKMEPISGKVYYKKPDKFRIKTKGIIFLPKQNPYYALTVLKDTNSYTAVSMGTEKIGNTVCTVINVIPNTDNDLILGKLWIDAQRGLMIKSQLTTKSNGTIQIDNTFGAQAANALPDKILFTIDVSKFKVPKMVAVDINTKTAPKTDNSNAKGTGVITLNFTNYKINQKLPDSVFTEE